MSFQGAHEGLSSEMWKKLSQLIRELDGHGDVECPEKNAGERGEGENRTIQNTRNE